MFYFCNFIKKIKINNYFYKEKGKYKKNASMSKDKDINKQKNNVNNILENPNLKTIFSKTKFE